MAFFLFIITSVAVSLPNLLGYNLIFGKGKIFHFGPLGVSLVAAYGIFVPLMMGYGYPLSLLIAFLLTMLISFLFAWLSLRMEPDAFGVVSLASHLGLLAVVLNWSTMTRGALGIPGIPRFPFLLSLQESLGLDAQTAFALLSIVLCVVWCVFLWWIDRGPFGRSIQALAEHPWHAQALGIDRHIIYYTVFFLGGMGALLTNVLYHQYIALLHPSDIGYPSLIFFLMVIVAGGPGRIRGCIFAAIALILLREGVRFLPFPVDLVGPIRLILFGVILFAAVWYRRDGIFPKPRGV